MTQDRKKLFIIGGIFLFVILSVVVYTRFNRSTPKTESETEVLPTEDVIPTVDSSVEVNLVSSSVGREVVLQLRKIPRGTESIDYELSYQTKQQGLQGVIGTITLDEGEDEYDKRLTLGTCSSGTCVYHQVEGSIRLSLKFTGDYGEKIFEEEYDI
ncbi:hypothetical protein HYW87_04480 [Candidatus Roizmanbacteria bacterium]|nr:hypothetical protein [Candidatus Roizmanbacteria bacterium]